MAYPGLAHEEHKYLGKEYCTGYTDVYGKWNTGFYCPQYGSKTAVFCCGTAVFKYCCTNQEPVDLSSSGGSGVLLDGDDPNFDGGPHPGVSSAVFVRVPIVFGVVCGIAAVLILLIVAACYFCSCCFAYKKRRNDILHSNPRHHHLHLNHHPGLPSTGLYRSTTGTNSTASSNLLNLYSPAATGPLTNSLVTTPLDLDWASSLASTYQSQQQLYVPSQTLPGIHQFSPGNPTLTPATAALAAALSQRPNSAASSLLYNTSSSSGIGTGGVSSGTPSVISASVTNTSGLGRNPYQSFLNTSTSTLSSTPVSRQQHHHQNPNMGSQLHRGNLPQQISTTASIVNSYLASLQQTQNQVQTHSSPSDSHVPPPPPSSHNNNVGAQPLNNSSLPPERTRHPSPPPSYFQTVSSSSYQNSGNNSYRNSTRANSSNSGSRSNNRMSTIQSILGGGYGSGYNNSNNFNLNEEDLLLADLLLRHENTLRRTLGLNNRNNSNNIGGGGNNNNATTNNTSNNNNNNNSNNSNNNSRNRSNPLLSQRELIDLLLRLTCNTNILSSSSSISRSESRAGSETNSTASSVATTRSTMSSSSSSNNGAPNGNHHHLHHSHSKTPSTASSGIGSTKLTISEVDEDLDELREVSSTMMGNSTTTSSLVPGARSKASLDLTLSRLSVENDSGVASSGCSTAGSEHASEGLIGGIKVISRDLSEEALKLKKQHAVDDEVGEDDEGLAKIKMCEQQLEAAIHRETNHGNVDKSTSASLGEGEVIGMKGLEDPSNATTPFRETTTASNQGEESSSVVIQTKNVVLPVPLENGGSTTIVPVHVKTSDTVATAQL